VTALRIALAQMNPTVGDLAGNVAAVQARLAMAEEMGCDLLITPELALTGYPPEDLLLKEGFLADTLAAVETLASASGDTMVVVGTVVPEGFGGIALAPASDGRSATPRLANALVLAQSGAVRGVATKRLLPNYDVFDEQRYFAPGAGPLAYIEVDGFGVGFLICEDIWRADGPALDLSARCHLLIVANASPYARGRRAEREAMLRDRARETNCMIVYVNMVGGQDELVFDGQSVVISSEGEVLLRGSAFRDELLVFGLEWDEEGQEPLVVPSVTAVPVVTDTVPPLDDVAEVYEALVTGTRDYLHKNGFTRALVALSGGVDSALVATIAADALGAAAVRCVGLPSRYSSDHSVNDAAELARRQGVTFEVLPIETVHAAFATMMMPALEGTPSGVTDENLQSRVRGVTMMALSNATGAMVLTTGNKSEIATGYSTLYGDSAGGFAVIKDVPKTLVYELCAWRNEQAHRAGATPPIPESILTKAPSAELRPDQRDDQSLPPYEVLDPLLERYVEGDATAAELIAEGHDPDLVRRITRLVDLAEYKRRQSPPGVRVSAKAFGKDRRLPITNAYRGVPS
jgi:NAD+ synthase (glutamine-hydrolysing)